jgi:hypothetical protein
MEKTVDVNIQVCENTPMLNLTKTKRVEPNSRKASHRSALAVLDRQISVGGTADSSSSMACGVALYA